MVNKTYYREVTVWRNDLYTAGLVTGFDDNVIRIVQICSLASACQCEQRQTSAHIL